MESHPNEQWQQVLSIIQTRLSKPSFETWFTSTRAVTFNDAKVVICAPNNFAREWLENRYTKLIRDTIVDYNGKSTDVKFIIESEEDKNVDLPPLRRNPVHNLR